MNRRHEIELRDYMGLEKGETLPKELVEAYERYREWAMAVHRNLAYMDKMDWLIVAASSGCLPTDRGKPKKPKRAPGLAMPPAEEKDPVAAV